MKKNALAVLALFFCCCANAQKIPAWKVNEVADYYSKKEDAVYVINFWATYCVPCIGEIPYLQSISKKYEKQHVKLLLVSLDQSSFYPRKIKAFAKKNNFTADIVWLDETDPNHYCPVIDKQWIGAMPATVFVNAATGYKKFVGSAMSEQQFESELRRAIGKD